MIGLGLLEAIPEEQILANADPDDADGDGISGKPNWVLVARARQGDARPLRLEGRRPHHQPSKRRKPFAGDIGLSTAMIRTPSGDCTEKQPACLDAPNGNSPKYQDVEVGDELFKLVTFYSQNLAVPARRDPDDPKC